MSIYDWDFEERSKKLIAGLPTNWFKSLVYKRLICVNPISARYGEYTTWKHVPAHVRKRKPQMSEIEKLLGEVRAVIFTLDFSWTLKG